MEESIRGGRSLSMESRGVGTDPEGFLEYDEGPPGGLDTCWGFEGLDFLENHPFFFDMSSSRITTRSSVNSGSCGRFEQQDRNKVKGHIPLAHRNNPLIPENPIDPGSEA